MIKNLNYINGVILCLTLFTIHNKTQSQTIKNNFCYGSIGGIIIDSISNEPLVGSNCVLDSTSLGASSGLNGGYLIQKVPPGCYRLKFSMVGYEKKIINNIKVIPGQTTNIDAFIVDYGTQSALEELSKGKIIIWRGGLVLPCDMPDSSITDKYGFRYGGPTVDPVTEYKHNTIIEKYLDERNGKGWEEKVNAEWKAFLHDAEVERQNGIRWICQLTKRTADTLILYHEKDYMLYYHCENKDSTFWRYYLGHDTLYLYNKLISPEVWHGHRFTHGDEIFKFLIGSDGSLISLLKDNYLFKRLRKNK
jgi:hypothetical protein